MSRIFRITKITIALILVGISLWAMLLPPYFPSSSHAVVNTRKISINSSTDGMVVKMKVLPRTMIRKGDVVARIEHDQTSLQRQIAELRFLQKKLETQIANNTTELTQRKKSLEQANVEYTNYKTKTIGTLDGELKNLHEKAAIEQREFDLNKESVARIKELLEKNIVTRAKWLEVDKSAIEAEKRLQNTRTEEKRVADELENARSGLHLAQTEGNDALTAEIAALQHETRNLETEKSDLQLQLTETKSLIETNSTYLNSLQTVDVDSPVDGMVWNCPSVEGQNIATGQTIVQVADHHSIFVESFFHRYYQESIFPGDYAFVQLRGEPSLLVGKVLEVNVQENGSDDIHIINSVAPSSSMLRVTIQLDQGNLTDDQIGRLGKVVVTSGRPGILNRILVELSLLLRNQA